MTISINSILNDPNALSNLSRIKFNQYLEKKGGVSRDCFLDEAIIKLGTAIYMRNGEAHRILNGIRAMKELNIPLEKTAAIPPALRTLGKGALGGLGFGAVAAPIFGMTARRTGEQMADDATAQLRDRGLQLAAGVTAMQLGRSGIERGAQHLGHYYGLPKMSSTNPVLRPPRPVQPPKILRRPPAAARPPRLTQTRAAQLPKPPAAIT